MRLSEFGRLWMIRHNLLAVDRQRLQSDKLQLQPFSTVPRPLIVDGLRSSTIIDIDIIFLLDYLTRINELSVSVGRLIMSLFYPPITKCREVFNARSVRSLFFANTGCGKKVAPKSFSLFSQRPLRILTWNFTRLFAKTSYI